MAKRNKIVKIKFNEKYFIDEYNGYYHKREHPFVMGYQTPDGRFMVQNNPAKKSYTWHVGPQHASIAQKPLILISVESDDKRKDEPQAQNKP